MHIIDSLCTCNVIYFAHRLQLNNIAIKANEVWLKSMVESYPLIANLAYFLSFIFNTTFLKFYFKCILVYFLHKTGSQFAMYLHASTNNLI